ncbi:MAG: hypothetical protein ACI97A_002110 [Planctomycetota bacterium]|jgi:hypothetical protein
MDNENQDVDDSMGLFEAAFQARHVDLKIPTISSILMLHDDSDQTDTVTRLAGIAAKKFGAEITEIASPALGMDAAEKVNYILKEAVGADLIVMPAPFGEDIGSLKTESLSSVVDLILAESQVPILIARNAIESVENVLENPVILLDWHERFQGIAASYGCLFAGATGEVELISTIDPATMSEMEALLGNDEDDMATFKRLIGRAETRLSGGIVAAVQKLGTTQGFDSRFEVQKGRESSKECADRTVEKDGFSVCSYLARIQSPSLNRIRDLILNSSQPVLCLPI